MRENGWCGKTDAGQRSWAASSPDRTAINSAIVPCAYSQPTSSAMRAASTRLRAPSLVTADSRSFRTVLVAAGLAFLS